jgi:hypothetical protein
VRDTPPNLDAALVEPSGDLIRDARRCLGERVVQQADTLHSVSLSRQPLNAVDPFLCLGGRPVKVDFLDERFQWRILANFKDAPMMSILSKVIRNMAGDALSIIGD